MTHEGVKDNGTTKRLTRKERRNAPAKASPPDTPELRADILRLLRQGATITELCGRPDMPHIATLFDMRRNDPDFGAAFQAAMVEHAETLISDAVDQSIAAVDDAETIGETDIHGDPLPARVHDEKRAKAAETYLNSVLKYAGAIAPAKYGTLVKLADAQIGNGIQISITSYATKPADDAEAGVSDASGTA